MKRSSNGIVNILFMLIYLLLGIFLIVNPEPSDTIICGVIGGALGLVGVVRVINYFKLDKYEAMLRKELALGLFLLLLAFFVIMKADDVETMIPKALGVLLSYEAMGLFQNAVDLIRTNIKYWVIDVVAGGILLTLGILALFDPFGKQITLMRFVGISFVVAAIATLVSVFLMRMFKKEYNKNEVVVANK